jgi:hypothetical protein
VWCGFRYESEIERAKSSNKFSQGKLKTFSKYYFQLRKKCSKNVTTLDKNEILDFVGEK